MDNLFSGKLNSSAQAVGVIMAGGSGTRFWPLSRSSRPKQFLPLTGSEASLIQATSSRLERAASPDAILVVTAGTQSELVREQLPRAAVLSEPCAKNTAPCIGYAALRVLHDIGDVPMICVPADHIIWNEENWVELLRQAAVVARKEDVLLTIGLKPAYPETGYGYIQRGEALPNKTFRVARFVEKPDRATAEKYLASGDYFWNSGMFVWRPSVVLKEIRAQLPKLAAGLDQISELWKAGGPADAANKKIAELYFGFDPVSIDYGIMEKAHNVVMLPGETFRWSDVGSWSAWADLEAEHVEEHGNFVRGDVVTVDSQGCFVLGNSGRVSQGGTASPGERGRGKFIAAVGVRDLIVVETDDALLICHRDFTQDVKKVVEELQKKGRKELL